MWDYCGMTRNEAGLKKAKDMVRELRSEFWSDLKVTGEGMTLTSSSKRQAAWPISSSWLN